MLNRQMRRLTISLDDIRSHDASLAEGLLNEPFDYSMAFNQALKEVVEAMPNRPTSERSADIQYYCAYVGSFGEWGCNPRTLRSSHLNHMVSLEGIVTKCSLVRPKVVKSVHYNEKRKPDPIWHFREYRDQTMSANSSSTSGIYPREDEHGNPVSTSCVI